MMRSLLTEEVHFFCKQSKSLILKNNSVPLVDVPISHRVLFCILEQCKNKSGFLLYASSSDTIGQPS